MKFEYRSYYIQRTRGLYIASPADGDDLVLSSSHAHRVVRSIDQMWVALETGVLPGWVSDMLKSGSSSIDLDVPEVAEQITSSNSWLDEARKLFSTKGFVGGELPKESAPSEVDPPKSFFFMLLALVSATGLAFLMHKFIIDDEPAIVFALAVVATAMVFGSIQAAILSGLSMIAYNLCIVPPASSFSIPTAMELIYFGINVGVSFLTPWWLNHARRQEQPVEGRQEVQSERRRIFGHARTGVIPYSRQRTNISSVPFPPGNDTAA